MPLGCRKPPVPARSSIGPTAYRLAARSLVVEDAGPIELKGIDGPLRAWRVVDMLDGPGRPLGPRAPLVGRDDELELLENTFKRSLRDKRAHLFTIYGEAGVGKSRLAREFLDGVERASVLIGRALPYGEAVTYWPLGEMVKAAAGISDDDPLEEAFEKLRECCAEEAVADVLGLAAGLMEALEGERSPQEIAWAAREVMQGIADVQPLVLLFEDVHWAEAPLLDLIEHIADRVRAPMLILCLARPELLDARPGWGGGRVRSTAIELEPLSEDESAELVEQLLSQLAGAAGERPASLPQDALDRAEGNPLFVEETIRMLVESGSGNGSAGRVPDTLQALIAARIDHLDPAAKTLLQRGAVIGRVFWRGALEHLSPDVEGHEELLDDLLQREFLLREPRSSISGEIAYRFKHALIREVAYTGMAKLARAQYHARFAEWLAERTGEELVEIRAYHLDQSVEFLTELEGAAPEELAQETSGALVKAAKRAIAREAYANARTLGLRALELHPTLGGRYVAARAAWRLQDWGAVQVEMAKVRDGAREEGDRVYEALALTALGEAALKRDGDASGARALVDEALELLPSDSDTVAQFDALTARAVIGAVARLERRLRAVHGACVREGPRRRAKGPADDRRPGARVRAHRPARARRGGDPADTSSRAGRRERERSGPHQRHAGVRRFLEGEGRARRCADHDGRGSRDRRGARHRACAGGVFAEAGLARAGQGRSQALGEALPRGPTHHCDAGRSRARARLPGRARDDAGRVGQDRRRGAARTRRPSPTPCPRTRAARSSP